MLNNVSVLIPFKPDKGIRFHTFKWVLKFYENVLPEIEVCIGENHDKLFNKSKAINTAAKKATKDVFVIADTDIVYNPQIIIQSINLLNNHAWVIPYSKCLDLTEASTTQLLKMEPRWPLPIKVEYNDRLKRNSTYKSVGGLIVLWRKSFNIVGGFDERFKGWGKEDDAFKNAMNTLCGRYRRIEAEYIYHLWHPKVGGKGNPNYINNKQLYQSYAKCNGNVSKMKKLINERYT
ncbi:galactosyltransferase-related protein [Alkalihalobacillus sp. BA299]|uniref:galactosyltransferase-related protein n=1 Tax=Alkalihalobacillus sp. BA299 TaxID=2815938 RepID=UPI001ADD1338|nr:galactosyltransferase-related protein [Alkalihalobacillus sp. BA299]